MAARLDVGKVVAGAFLVPWWRRQAFARRLAIPTALLIACGALLHYYAADGLPWYAALLVNAVYGALFTLFAVACHRLVLLDAQAAAGDWRPRWTHRETLFFLWIVGVWVFWVIGLLVGLTLVAGAWGTFGGYESVDLQWAEHAVNAVLLYPFGRLCVLLPATAVDQYPQPGVRWAWRLTRGNGWRMLVIVGALPWLLSLLVDLVHRSDAGPVEWLLVSLLAMALLVVEIAAVSISYRELTA